ncbi:MAG TPA: hypothetical protein VFH27_08125 [Longimicrobiaceae bacterium]|nr:hypothetical protein [Longimicrobiaceae bacterium]
MLPWRTRLGAAAVAAGALAACPALQAQRPPRAEQTLVEVEGYRGVLTQDPGIRFTADVRDVESADSGAALVLSLVMRDGSTRRVQVEGGPGGRLERSYRVAGAPAPYDSSAARWLHLVLPRVAPRTFLFHRTRMGRVIREQGVDSLLAQLARTPQPRPGMPGY